MNSRSFLRTLHLSASVVFLPSNVSGKVAWWMITKRKRWCRSLLCLASEGILINQWSFSGRYSFGAAFAHLFPLNRSFPGVQSCRLLWGRLCALFQIYVPGHTGFVLWHVLHIGVAVLHFVCAFVLWILLSATVVQFPNESGLHGDLGNRASQYGTVPVSDRRLQVKSIYMYCKPRNTCGPEAHNFCSNEWNHENF